MSSFNASVVPSSSTGTERSSSWVESAAAQIAVFFFSLLSFTVDFWHIVGIRFHKFLRGSTDYKAECIRLRADLERERDECIQLRVDLARETTTVREQRETLKRERNAALERERNAALTLERERDAALDRERNAALERERRSNEALERERRSHEALERERERNEKYAESERKEALKMAQDVTAALEYDKAAREALMAALKTNTAALKAIIERQGQMVMEEQGQ
ncbi:hypothetical protein V8E54_007749 [Elaphomyces granulatus]